MFLQKIFSSEPCNTGRQLEIDLSKCGMILELVLCHCFIECSTDERLLHGLPYIFDSVIGGPLGAPGFMIAMGIGMVYTRHNSAKDFAQRGLILALYSFLLNLCRFTIPFLIGYAITGDAGRYLEDIVYLTLENDILMFASLTFLIMALMIWMKIPDWLMLLFAFVMSGVATLLNGIDLGNDAANIFVGYFFGTEDADGRVCSYFTLFNWLTVPVFGYVYGHYYQRVKDKTLFHLVFAVPALVLTIVYLAIRMPARVGVFGEGQLCYYHITTIDILGALCAAVARLGIFYAITHIVPEALKAFFRETASNVTSIYCIQWVLVIVIADLILYLTRGTSELPDILIILLGLGIVTASIIIAHYYKKFMRQRRQKHEPKQQTC